MADPRDLKFFPSDMTLVDHYLRRRIDTDKEGFIKDIKLYEDDPWLLPHVNNNLFNEKEWFYFVKRTLKAGTTPNRTVLGRGGSNGGTWKNNGSKEAIFDRNKVVIGYKAEFSYYKHVKGQKQGDPTGWCMTEYWIASKNKEFQETVLCYIRGRKKQVKNVSTYASSNRGFAPCEDMITMVDPSHLKFFPTDLKLVDHYLRNRVNTDKDGFIKDIKLYEDEPWRLPHVKNDQFIEKGWFYFVKRTCESGNKIVRMVPGRGGSGGGTWNKSGLKKNILDTNNVVIGYQQELSYYKHVRGHRKTKKEPTGWCMTEYWLASENAAEFVLCNIRVKKNVDDQFQLQTIETNNNIVEQPPLDNNTVSNAFLTGDGGEGCDSETGQQNMDADDYRFMFDTELLDFIYQEQPLMLPQDSIPPLGGQDLRSTMDQHMDEYAQELENILDKDEYDEHDRVTQHPHIPLPLGSVNQQREQERMIDTFGEVKLLGFIEQQKPQMLPHDSVPPLGGQDLRSTTDQHMEEYAEELENILDNDEDDEHDRATQHPHIPLPLQVQDSGNPLVMTEDECAGRQYILNLDQHMEEYAEELENILDSDEEEDDDDSASQQQHPHIPLPPQVQVSGNPLVIMEDECVNQNIIFNLESVTQRREQEKMVDTLGEMDCARLKMQGNLYFQDSYFAGIQHMSPWDNVMTNNNPLGPIFDTHKYEMQEPPVTNGVNKKSLGYVANCAMQEERRKRRKQC